MAANTKLDEQQARKWIEEAENLKEDADMILKDIASCLKGMEDANDDVTKAIYQVGAEFGPKFAELTKSVGEMIRAFDDVIKKWKDMANDAVEGIKSAVSNTLGGITITATIE